MQIDCQAYSTAQTYAQDEVDNQIVERRRRAEHQPERHAGRHRQSARATDDYLTLTGGAQGTYLNSVLYITSAIVSSPAYLELIGGSTGVQAYRSCPPSTAGT